MGWRRTRKSRQRERGKESGICCRIWWSCECIYGFPQDEVEASREGLLLARQGPVAQGATQRHQLIFLSFCPRGHSSLQEIAPLTYGYLGGQFLSPYFNPFKEALNLAALELEQSSRTGPSSSSSTTTTTTENSNNNLLNPRANLQRSRSTLSTLFQRQPDYPYKLIEARNVGMTAIMLFARKPDAIHHIQHAECAFGIANMGNKGAIALRVMYAADGAGEGEGGVTGKAASEEAEGERRVVEVTFVATHLAAMEYNLRRRNANWMR